MLNLAVLISGRGSNLVAIQQNIISGVLQGVARIVVVASNKAEAKGLCFAKEQGIPCVVGATEEQILAGLAEYAVDLVCLAGYMRIISPKFLAQYPGKVINIHPTLLPKFPGLHVHQQVIAAGEVESGCTVHYVDEGVDTGEIIAQAKVPVLPGDTPDVLAARVLEQEHQLYSKVILQLATS